MSHYVPQPRYAKEHRDSAKRQRRPLGTLDLYVPGHRRITSTGVASDEWLDDMIQRLQRVRDGKYGYEEGEK